MNRYSFFLLSLSFLGLFSCKIAKLKEQSSRSLQKESVKAQRLHEEFHHWQSERTDSLGFTEGLIWFPGKVRTGPGNSLEADSAWMQFRRLSRVSSGSEGHSFALQDSLADQQELLHRTQQVQVKEKENSGGLWRWAWMILLALVLVMFRWRRYRRGK